MGGLIAAILLASGCGKGNEFAPPPKPEVTVMNPLQQDITVYRAFPGRTEAVDFVEVRARVKGYLQEVNFLDGERVEKGAELFLIEQAPFIASLKSAEANVAQAKASSKLAESDYERKKQARKTEAVSEIDLLAAEAEFGAATAAVLSAEAQLDQAHLDLSYTQVQAPVGGRISRRLVSTGNLVGGNDATLLTTIAVEEPIYVYFDLDERTILKYANADPRPDQVGEKLPPVMLEFADGKKHVDEGKVDYVDNTLNPETGTLRARATFPNPGGRILPGQFARVLIPEISKDAILVPELCIQRDLVGPYLLVVDDAGLVESVYVELGSRVENQRIITAGLKKADRVIVKGLQRARPGVEVQATEASEKDVRDVTLAPGESGNDEDE